MENKRLERLERLERLRAEAQAKATIKFKKRAKEAGKERLVIPYISKDLKEQLKAKRIKYGTWEKFIKVIIKEL